MEPINRPMFSTRIYASLLRDAIHSNQAWPSPMSAGQALAVVDAMGVAPIVDQLAVAQAAQVLARSYRVGAAIEWHWDVASDSFSTQPISDRPCKHCGMSDETCFNIAPGPCCRDCDHRA